MLVTSSDNEKTVPDVQKSPPNTKKTTGEDKKSKSPIPVGQKDKRMIETSSQKYEDYRKKHVILRTILGESTLKSIFNIKEKLHKPIFEIEVPMT